MYRQFDTSDKPKSAARLLAEAAFAPPSGSRHGADTPAPVVKVINRRFVLRGNYRQASNDAQPAQTPAPAVTTDLPQAQQPQQAPQIQQAQAPVAAKTARVFLLPAPAVEAGGPSEADAALAVPVASTPASAVASAAESASFVQSVSPADAPTARFADPSDVQVPPPQRSGRLLRKSRRTSPHGPVRVIYSAPPAVFVAPQADVEVAGADTALSEPQQLESILFLQQQMAEVDALLADIQFAENFDIDLGGASTAAELKGLLAELDRMSAQFSKAAD